MPRGKVTLKERRKMEIKNLKDEVILKLESTTLIGANLYDADLCGANRALHDGRYSNKPERPSD